MSTDRKPTTPETADTSGSQTGKARTYAETGRESAIQQCLAEMPNSFRATYLRATSGRASPRLAIKAFCCECVCWQRDEVRRCTGLACPLWAYRPFQRNT